MINELVLLKVCAVKLLKGLGFLIIVLFVIGIFADKPSTRGEVAPPAQAATVTQARAQEVQTSLPANERNFLSVVSSFHQKYDGASNDFQKGVLYRNRADALRSALSSGPNVSGWIGKVYRLSSNGDGYGVIEITLSEDAWVKTWNNSFSDSSDHTLIKPTSLLYSTRGGLNEGDVVVFSGTFLPAADSDVMRTTSLSMSSKMTEPEFLFRFTSIDKKL